MNKLSIITISYNKANFIESTILSVLRQKNVDVEYIIIDGGSTDGSLNIINKYKNSLAYYISEPDNGPANALNKGIAKATGNIIGFINSDDTYNDQALEKVDQYFSSHPHVDCILGNGNKMDKNGKIIRKVYSDPFNLRQYLAGSLTIFQPSIFFRQDVIEKIGGFNEANKICWDGELLVDFALNKIRIKSIPDFLANIRIYDETISSSENFRDKYDNERLRIFKKAYKKSPNKIFQYILFHWYRILKTVHSPQKFFAYINDRLS